MTEDVERPIQSGNLFEEGVKQLREMYEKQYSLVTESANVATMPFGSDREVAHLDFLGRSNLVSTMLTLEAEGKIELPEDLKQKMTQDIDAMLESTRVSNAGEVGKLVLQISKAMRDKSKQLG